MTISCVTDCWLIPFQNSFVEELIRQEPDFAVTLTRYYSKVMRQLCFDAATQSIHSSFIRLAYFLLANWDSEENSLVRLSQQELAYAANCSRSSVARACKALKQEGVIATEGVGFRLVDRARLEELVCRETEKP